MPLLVTTANSSNELIDFTKHTSPDGFNVSATYLLARQRSACVSENLTNKVLYPAIGDFVEAESMNSVTYEVNYFISSVSCASSDKQFERIQHSETLQLSAETDLSGLCQFNKSLSKRHSSVWQENGAVTCKGNDTEVMDMWCASFLFFACIAHFRRDNIHLYLHGSTPRNLDANDEDMEWTLYAVSYPAIHSQTLKSAAYLVALGRELFPRVIVLSRTTIKRNVPVEVVDGKVFETKVSVSLFLGSAGVVTVITVAVCIIALIEWRREVVQHGLTGKNGFKEAMDLLTLAAKLGADEEEVASNEEVVVGVSGGEPRVGPMAESSIGDGAFDEHGVDGRLRRRTRELVLRVEQ
ncbi:hypothetical protein FGB62_124g03 [Gracilaria domingensis]|nr:hypothetical protein FGB62_124g03 [Gracilaria domingensis]